MTDPPQRIFPTDHSLKHSQLRTATKHSQTDPIGE